MHPLRYARAGSIYEDGSNRVYALVNKNEGICELADCVKTQMQHETAQHYNGDKGLTETLVCILLHQRLILALRRSGDEFSHGLLDLYVKPISGESRCNRS